jgi:hypothetical protein
MAIQDFTAGQVLTAAQMDSLQANDYNQTVSTKTASYTLVAADKGTRVVMNSASATTITVNTSLFSAGDTLILQNIGVGTCTVTAGTATVSTVGSLNLTQNSQGTLYFTSAGVSIFYPTAIGWQSYTPTFTNFTLGNGTLIAKYIQIGKFVSVKFEVTLGSTSSMGTAPAISLPVTASSSITSQGSALGFSLSGDSGTASYYGAVTYGPNADNVYIWYFDIASAKLLRGTITATAPMTWVTADTLAAQFIYEAA